MPTQPTYKYKYIHGAQLEGGLFLEVPGDVRLGKQPAV